MKWIKAYSLLLALLSIYLSGSGNDPLSVGVLTLLPGLISLLSLIAYYCLRQDTTNISSIMLWCLTSFFIVATVVFTSWPLRLAFHLSRGSLNNTADIIRKERVLKMPIRVGLFRIEEAGVKEDRVYLYTSNGTGFVNTTADSLSAYSAIYVSVNLSDDWQFLLED